MPQLILSNAEERIVDPSSTVDRAYPVGTDVDFPDVLADLDVDGIPEEVTEYGRTRLGETEESRTKLLAELEDMIYGKHSAAALHVSSKRRDSRLVLVLGYHLLRNDTLSIFFLFYVLTYCSRSIKINYVDLIDLLSFFLSLRFSIFRKRKVYGNLTARFQI